MIDDNDIIGMKTFRDCQSNPEIIRLYDKFISLAQAFKDIQGIVKKKEIKYGDEEYPAGFNDSCDLHKLAILKVIERFEENAEKWITEARTKYCRDECPDRNKVRPDCSRGRECIYINDKLKASALTKKLKELLGVK